MARRRSGKSTSIDATDVILPLVGCFFPCRMVRCKRGENHEQGVLWGVHRPGAQSAGLTQQALAEKVQITNKAVSKWERELSYPDVTLLEPLAAALGLGVEELMACRRTADETAETMERGEEPMKNLLTISGDTLRRERNCSRNRLAGVLALVLVTALVVTYSLIFVTEQREDDIFLKETQGETNYLYVQKDGHLLKLKCGTGVDFDAISTEKQPVYRMDCRRNRLTYEGVVSACEPTDSFTLGSPMDEVGSGLMLDTALARPGFSKENGPYDSLFGSWYVSCQIEDCYPNPSGQGDLTSYGFKDETPTYTGVGTSAFWLVVEDCFSYTISDWDDDGMSELLVRTRWPEKPYTVYDMVDGEIVETWPDTVPDDIRERLLTIWEQ